MHDKLPSDIHTHMQTGMEAYRHTHLTALFPGLPIWILLKQETVIGSSISWAICKSAPRSRQITMPAPHHSIFYRPDALPATQPTMEACRQTYTWISMSMWSLRWHFMNKSVTGAAYKKANYSIKSYSLSHSRTLWWIVRWLKHAVPSWGHGGTAAMMAQNEQTREEHSTLEQQSLGRLDHPAWRVKHAHFAVNICSIMHLFTQIPKPCLTLVRKLDFQFLSGHYWNLEP